MKNAAIFIMGLIFAVNPVLAGDAKSEQENKLGIQLDATWVSKYIWHGQDLYGDRAAFQPSITLDLFGSGFNTGVWGSTACSSGFVDSEELDYWAAYTNSLFGNGRFKTDYEVKWLYYDYFRLPSGKADSQEIVGSFSWPNIFPCGVVPNYTLSYVYCARSHCEASDLKMEGFLHTFGFTYDFNAPKVDLPLTFSWDISYNDGQGGADFDHEWAYTTWGLSSYIEFGPGGFTPAIYYQKTMDKSVNEEDELWCSFSYTIDF
jgi:hypothetical protein